MRTVDEKTEAKKNIRLFIIAAGTDEEEYENFYHARENVIQSYISIDAARHEIVKKEAKTAKELVDIINNYNSDEICSLDIFSHGGRNALYMTKGNVRYRPPDYNLMRSGITGMGDGVFLGTA
jgi:hypothetical protein